METFFSNPENIIWSNESKKPSKHTNAFVEIRRGRPLDRRPDPERKADTVRVQRTRVCKSTSRKSEIV